MTDTVTGKRYRQCRQWLLQAYFALLLCCPLQAMDDRQRLVSEQEALVSVLLYNFLLFVDWPESQQPRDNERWQICALGDDGVLARLQALIERPARGHAIALQRLSSIDTPRGCHMLYVAAGTKAPASEMLTMLGAAHVLTIASGSAFIDQGGMIRLLTTDGRLRIGVHLKNLRSAGLQISTRLLALPQVETLTDDSR